MTLLILIELNTIRSCAGILDCIEIVDAQSKVAKKAVPKLLEFV